MTCYMRYAICVRSARMKITEVNTYSVRPRWGFVEIVTDEGIIGWGEAVLEGHTTTVLACVQEMKTYLLDRILPISKISGRSCTMAVFTAAAGS